VISILIYPLENNAAKHLLRRVFYQTSYL
jgi:hypothetical protein